MEVFLDLEETLIIDWFNPSLKEENISIIKSFLISNKIKEVTLFSAAVWTKKEEKAFNEQFKDFLEEVLNVKIKVLLLEKAFDKVIKANGIAAENSSFFCDIFLFNQKEEFFKQWLLAEEKKGEFVLFDDTVDDSIFIKKDLKIILKNVK